MKKQETHIDIKLAHEAREIAMLKVLRKQVKGEMGNIQNGKTIVRRSPGDD